MVESFVVERGVRYVCEVTLSRPRIEDLDAVCDRNKRHCLDLDRFVLTLNDNPFQTFNLTFSHF